MSTTDINHYTGTWTLDPARTSITFRTKAMWVLPVKGAVRALEGGGTVGPDGSVQGTLVIDAKSIDTGTKKRDEHLRTADFLDTDHYPTMKFELTSARPLGGSRFALEGRFQVRDQTQPLSVTAEVTADGDTATVKGTVDDLDRRSWGVDWAKMGAGVHNQVEVTAVFRRS